MLLVSLNNQGRNFEHRYQDYFIDERTFHWQSQNNTTPASNRERDIIEQEKLTIDFHLLRDGPIQE